MIYNASVGWNEWFMQGVYWVASKSKDPKTRIGAILVKDNRIISTGFNGLPQGVLDKPDRLERPLKYLYVSHAERNALYSAARHGIVTENSVLYTNALPCTDCMKGLIQSGIKNIYIHKQFEDECGKITRIEWEKHKSISMQMCKEADIQLHEINIKLGIETLLDGKIITV